MSLSVWVTSRFMAFSVWITSCFHIAKNRSMGGGQEMPMTAVVKLNPPCMLFDDIVRVWFYRRWWTTCSERMRLLVSVLLSLRSMGLTRWVVSAQLLLSDLFLFFFALSVCGQSHKTLQIPHIEIQTYQDFFFKVYKIFVFSLGGFDFTNSNQ
jgi:hypothetical protein